MVDPEALTELFCETTGCDSGDIHCCPPQVTLTDDIAIIDVRIMVRLGDALSKSFSKSFNAQPKCNDSVTKFVLDTRERAISLLSGSVSSDEEVALMKVIRALRG